MAVGNGDILAIQLLKHTVDNGEIQVHIFTQHNIT